MIGLEPFLWVAEALHGLIAVSNLAAARLYRYREEMAKVSPFVCGDLRRPERSTSWRPSGPSAWPASGSPPTWPAALPRSGVA